MSRAAGVTCFGESPQTDVRERADDVGKNLDGCHDAIVGV
jgi:hypothetical protein